MSQAVEVGTEGGVEASDNQSEVTKGEKQSQVKDKENKEDEDMEDKKDDEQDEKVIEAQKKLE